MDELTRLKAEAYDLVAQIQQLQRMLDEKNQQIAALHDVINSSPPTRKPKDK
jgi:uncharacterized protein (DUF3084 family)